MTETFLSGLIVANDEKIEPLRDSMRRLRERTTDLGRAAATVVGAGGVCHYIGSLASAYVSPSSRFHAADWVPDEMSSWAEFLAGLQYEDGSFDAAMNRKSPPDTAFYVRSLAATAEALRSADSRSLADIRSQLESVIRRGGEILVTGGIHTPNHRWIVCDALARTNALFPDHRYVARIDEWLSEGVDIDPDGQFSERSVGIYSGEVDKALISVAVRLNRDDLLEPVRKNLETTLYFVEPNGELQTIGSRRQDQATLGSESRYYLPFLFMAHHDGNARFAAAAGEIERRSGALLCEELIYLLGREYRFTESLPETSATAEAAPGDDYEKVFPSMGVVRIRKNGVTATILGHTDWSRNSISGLSSNPTFFTFRAGHAVVDSVRMVSDFFDLGYFRAERFERLSEGYLLERTLKGPYYQPLPPGARKADGMYELTSADDRFYGRLSFSHRERSEVQTLRLQVEIRANGEGFQLMFRAAGSENVPIAIEIALRSGGLLRGVTGPLGNETVYALESGYARYERQGSAIEFGPGAVDFLWGDDVFPVRPDYLNPPSGATTVYITGHTPFERSVFFRQTRL